MYDVPSLSSSTVLHLLQLTRLMRPSLVWHSGGTPPIGYSLLAVNLQFLGSSAAEIKQMGEEILNVWHETIIYDGSTYLLLI